MRALLTGLEGSVRKVPTVLQGRQHQSRVILAIIAKLVNSMPCQGHAQQDTTVRFQLYWKLRITKPMVVSITITQRFDYFDEYLIIIK